MVTRKISQLKMTVEAKSRSLKILQWSFLCLNVLILCSGVALMSMSVSSLVQRQEFRKDSGKNLVLVENDNQMTLFINITACGISVPLIFLSFFGFCGAFGEKKCLLSYYLAFVLINLALVFFGAHIVLRFSKKPGDVLKEHMSNYHRNKSSRARVDKIRSNLNCCGINAFHNLDDLKAEIENKILTMSCCLPQNKKGCHEMLEGRHTEIKKWEEINEIIYTEGCLLKITEMSARTSKFTLPFFIVIGVINLAGLLLATALCCSI